MTVAPYFVHVDGRTERVIGEGSAATLAQLGSLLERAAANAAAGLPTTDARKAGCSVTAAVNPNADTSCDKTSRVRTQICPSDRLEGVCGCKVIGSFETMFGK